MISLTGKSGSMQVDLLPIQQKKIKKTNKSERITNMNTENKKDMVVIPENFQFEEPTLTEFTYNKVASVQGVSVVSGTDDKVFKNIANGKDPYE